MRGVGRTILKIFGAFVLIAVAAVASLLIKETLDSTDPENNMPLIEASVGYTKLNVVRANFEWNFITRPSMVPPSRMSRETSRSRRWRSPPTPVLSW